MFSSYGMVPPAPLRTWRFSACPISLVQAHPSCASRENWKTPSLSWSPLRATPGKAALEGFRDKEGVQIAVMYPEGGVSDIQYKQMATQAGSNVMVWAVKGNFDDCQTGAKNVFGDEAFAEKLMASNQVALSSANSINWGSPASSGWFTTFPATLNWCPGQGLKLASRLMSAFLLAISATSSLHGTQSRSARLWVPCSAQAMKIAFSPISSIPAATTFPIVSSS